MFTKNLLKTIQQEASGWHGPLLSVYLNVNPAEKTNLNKGYLTRFDTGVRTIEGTLAADNAAAQQFRDAVKPLRKALQDYQPDAKALMIFRTPEGLEVRRGLRVRVRETVAWAKTPALEPLVEALDENERYGVALVDRGRARLFVAHLGEIEEIADFVGENVARAKTAGTDYRWSESKFQRRADEHAKAHARDVAQALAEADREYGFDRVLLAGALEAREQLAAQLSKRLQRKLARSVALAVVAPPQEVLETIDEVHADVERAEEVDLVGRMMTAAAKKRQAVAGLQPTVQALSEGRIRELVISGNYHPNWDDLPQPAPWLHTRPNDASEDLLERMLDQTWKTGGRIEVVWGAAAERLEQEAGGVGAMLRY